MRGPSQGCQENSGKDGEHKGTMVVHDYGRLARWCLGYNGFVGLRRRLEDWNGESFYGAFLRENRTRRAE